MGFACFPGLKNYMFFCGSDLRSSVFCNLADSWQRIFIEIMVRYMRANFGSDFLASWMDCVLWGVTSPHTSGGDFDDSV